MTARSRHLFAAAAWWATLAVVLVWWLPSIALIAARLMLGRLRFRLTLVAIGLRGATWWVYAAEAELAGQGMRAVQERWGW